MPATITLTFRPGSAAQAVHRFDERTTCVIGRDGDCTIRLPDDPGHSSVSRVHCVLDLNPPDARIRDLGSKLGTFVNGEKIGQRASEEERGQGVADERDLKDGDEVHLGNPKSAKSVVFRVAVAVPIACACGAEIADADRAAAEQSPGVFRCPACRRNAAAPPPARRCSRCGRDVAGEAGAERRGAYVCGRCKAEPGKILHHLLDLARSGDRSLAAIEGYEVERELDRGGMGAVYLARHVSSGERVALKVMLPEVAANPIAVGRFLREAHLTRSLRHRHIVQLHDAGCSEGTFFLTMQYCDGGSVLQQMKARGRTLAIDEAANILLAVLAGLEYAHRQQVTVKLPDGSEATADGLVHRDLKPHNLFLSGSGAGQVARIGDYGLAKAFDLAGLSGQTATGAAAGTPSFMPRQQLVNFKYARPEVDVWAAAATFYYLLTGRTPRDFPKGQDPWQIVLRHPAVPIRQRLPAIPERLAAVIDEALIDQPEIRFQTAGDLRRALEAVL